MNADDSQENFFFEPDGSDAEPGLASKEDVDEEVARLLAIKDGGSLADAQTRRHCSLKLAALRAAFRDRPALFDAAAIAALKSLAEKLRNPIAPTRRAGVPSDPQEVLRTVFGYDAFRPGQKEIIDAVLAGRDCIGVMPTGAGKSITYQIPARILGGVTLVVSPLIALMKDQVDGMQEIGIKATFLNSSLEPEEKRNRVDALRRGEYELVYAAPEGLEASIGWALSRLEISLIAIDEAHCISQWGHDFRPAYRNLAGLKNRFGNIPVLALTATATQAVTKDIVQQLAMTAPAEFRGSFFRPNLHIHAYKKGGDAEGVRERILRLVRARAGQSGIIYCISRKSTESTAEYLADRGVKAKAYHAGMTPEKRSKVQDAFQNDDVDVICATIAFGMGIDKSNIRYVIHRDMPKSIESYYQEIGRAGRDGVRSDCILFFSWADVLSYDRFGDDVPASVSAWHKRQSREMFRLAERPSCRHQGLVAYLGESILPCGTSCDSCVQGDVIAETPDAPRKRKGAEIRAAQVTAPVAAGTGAELFLKLKELRRRIAQSKGLPPYIVFSDAALLDMVHRKPASDEELMACNGVGPKKLAQYGAEFLAAIRDHSQR